MGAWVYFLSKFTDEALLLEGVLACLLVSVLAATWILRRKRQGTLVPANLVKDYLSGVATDTQEMHRTLFGESLDDLPPPSSRLTSAPVADPPSAATTAVTPSGSTDPQVLELEAKLAQQLREIQALSLQKSEMEKEIAAARAAGGILTDPAPSDGTAAPAEELKHKVKELEARLEEYSVIEDDLANLKRLQQENSKLKAQIQASGGALPNFDEVAKQAETSLNAPEKPAAAPEKAPEKPAEKPAPAAAAAAPAPAKAEEPAKEAPAPAATAAKAAAPAQPAATPEKAAEKTPPAAAAAPASEPPAEAAAPAKPKNDDELIAEFEKMLSS